jgi:hypothetical protein
MFAAKQFLQMSAVQHSMTTQLLLDLQTVTQAIANNVQWPRRARLSAFSFLARMRRAWNELFVLR